MRFAIAATVLALGSAAGASDDRQHKTVVTENESSSGRTPARKRTRTDPRSVVQRLLKNTAQQPQKRRQNRRRRQTESNVLRNNPNDDLSVATTTNEIPHRRLELGLGILGIENDEPSDRRDSIFDQSSIRDRPESSETTASGAISAVISTTPPITTEPAVLVVESDFLVPNLENLCRQGFCDCTDFDLNATQGFVECTTETDQPGGYCASTINYCNEDVALCYRQTIELEAFGPNDYIYTTCTTYTEPYLQHVCITLEENQNTDGSNTTTVYDDPAKYYSSNSSSSEYYEYSGSPCAVQFNNQECNSCTTQLRTFREMSGTEVLATYNRCFVMDCSNVVEGHVVNTCDQEPTTIRETVVFGDDCTRCPPCGIGFHMANEEAYGDFPVIGSYRCSGLELGGFVGFFDRGICPDLQAKTNEYCGCEPDFYDPTLVLTTATTADEKPDKTNRNIGGAARYQVERDESAFVLPGDTNGAEACHLCGSNTARVALGNNLVNLPNGKTTTCSSLEGAGRLGMMTPAYCQQFAMPLVFHSCGGCIPAVSGRSASSPQEEMRPQTRSYREAPEEINVGEDANGKYGKDQPPLLPKAAAASSKTSATSSAETSSAVSTTTTTTRTTGVLGGIVSVGILMVAYFV